MPQFNPFVKTVLGVALDDKLSLSGASLQLTRLAIGSGAWPEDMEPAALTNLLDERLSAVPGQATPYAGGSYRVGGVLTNQGLAEGFHWRESGLFALDPDEGEILYMAASAADQDKVDWIPAEGVCLVEDYFSFLVLSAGGVEVTVRLDDPVVLATRRDLARLRRLWQLTARQGGAAGSLDAIPWGEIEPHDTAEVLAEGVLWRYRWDKDSTAAESDSVIMPDDAAGRPGRWLLRGTRGEAELWGALSAHAARTDNPHGVSKAQVGLGNVENLGLATQAEAEAGTVNNQYMTPLRAAQAIAALAAVKSVAGKTGAVTLVGTDVPEATEAVRGTVLLANGTPAALGTAAKGSSTRAAKADHVHPMPTPAQVGLVRGVIAMWSGAVAEVPAGWALCDGQNGTPDLRDRFIVGAGGSYAPGASGGSGGVTPNTSAAPGHTHPNPNTAGATLSAHEMPNHSHHRATRPVAGSGGSGRVWGTDGVNNGSHGDYVDGSGGGGAHAHGIGATGSSGGHSHTVTIPHYALAYIMKL